MASATSGDNEQNFSHHSVKRLPAEVLIDAIRKVTGESESFPGRPRGTRAIELWDNRLPSSHLPHVMDRDGRFTGDLSGSDQAASIRFGNQCGIPGVSGRFGDGANTACHPNNGPFESILPGCFPMAAAAIALAISGNEAGCG